MNTYNKVPGLGRQRRERENTVSITEGEKAWEEHRVIVVGNIMTEKKKEGRPVKFLL